MHPSSRDGAWPVPTTEAAGSVDPPFDLEQAWADALDAQEIRLRALRDYYSCQGEVEGDS